MDRLQTPEFRSHVEDLMNKYHVPGLAVAIVHRDRTLSEGFGLASLEPPVPCTADTLFDIASSSKSLTAASVGLLVEDNARYPEVQYRATMASLLPDDFVMSDPEYTKGVTVDDILSHRTGLPSHDGSYLGVRAAQPDDARSVTRNLRHLPVSAPIRSKYMYSNIMYTVATHLVEVKTGQSFSHFLDDRFFQPLGMKSTCLQPGRARARGHGERIATGHFWSDKQAAYRLVQDRDCPEGQGAGSVVSSANDFIKWVKALMRREGRISETVYHGLVRMRSFPNPSGRRLKPHSSPVIYAAGLEMYYYRGHAIVGHDGCICGFASRFFFLPGLQFGGVILGNAEGAGSVATTLVRHLIDELIGVPEEDRPYLRKSNAQRVTSIAKSPSHPKLQQSSPTEASASATAKDKENSGMNPAVASPATSPSSRETDLDAYVGTYWHPGYHQMKVQIVDGKLFIDASDRSGGFTITFERPDSQTECTAYLHMSPQDDLEDFRAEFVFQGGRAAKLGLHIEEALDELIWFDRIAVDELDPAE